MKISVWDCLFVLAVILLLANFFLFDKGTTFEYMVLLLLMHIVTLLHMQQNERK